MLPSKSCKTINANFLLKNFGLTFFDRFKTGTYLVNWFGRGSADRTWRFGGSAEPCRTSKFGRYRCRCRFIGRSLVVWNIFWCLVMDKMWNIGLRSFALLCSFLQKPEEQKRNWCFDITESFHAFCLRISSCFVVRKVSDTLTHSFSFWGIFKTQSSL